jgi:hypothetical protein
MHFQFTVIVITYEKQLKISICDAQKTMLYLIYKLNLAMKNIMAFIDSTITDKIACFLKYLQLKIRLYCPANY